MRILYLTGPHGNAAILSYLQALEEDVVVWTDTVEAAGHQDFVVACNYKHIVSPGDWSLDAPIGLGGGR